MIALLMALALLGSQDLRAEADTNRPDQRRSEMGFGQNLAQYEANFARYPPCTP